MVKSCEMAFVDIVEFGGPEVLQIKKRPIPVPQNEEVLIKVEAAGINRPDVFQRKGLYPPPPGAPDYPGLEIAGKIVSIGRGISDWVVGDSVCALVAGGGYAEYCVAPACQVLAIPKGLSMVEAAALPETFFTVWHNVFDRARLRPGESLLVHGGSSGIGTTAIQMAVALGSPVYTTAGSDEKCSACRKLGATLAINYRKHDFATIIQEYTNGKGVSVILDMIAGDYVQRNIKTLSTEGRLIFIAFLQSPKAEINFSQVMSKRITISGSTLRPQSIAVKGKIADGLQETIWPLIESGRIHPVIDTVYSFEDVTKAHSRMESSKHIGKLILAL